MVAAHLATVLSSCAVQMFVRTANLSVFLVRLALG
jgi:hypothetical protein